MYVFKHNTSFDAVIIAWLVHTCEFIFHTNQSLIKKIINIASGSYGRLIITLHSVVPLSPSPYYYVCTWHVLWAGKLQLSALLVLASYKFSEGRAMVTEGSKFWQRTIHQVILKRTRIYYQPERSRLGSQEVRSWFKGNHSDQATANVNLSFRYWIKTWMEHCGHTVDITWNK